MQIHYSTRFINIKNLVNSIECKVGFLDYNSHIDVETKWFSVTPQYTYYCEGNCRVKSSTFHIFVTYFVLATV